MLHLESYTIVFVYRNSGEESTAFNFSLCFLWFSNVKCYLLLVFKTSLFSNINLFHFFLSLLQRAVTVAVILVIHVPIPVTLHQTPRVLALGWG